MAAPFFVHAGGLLHNLSRSDRDTSWCANVVRLEIIWPAECRLRYLRKHPFQVSGPIGISYFRWTNFRGEVRGGRRSPVVSLLLSRTSSTLYRIGPVQYVCTWANKLKSWALRQNAVMGSLRRPSEAVVLLSGPVSMVSEGHPKPRETKPAVRLVGV